MAKRDPQNFEQRIVTMPASGDTPVLPLATLEAEGGRGARQPFVALARSDIASCVLDRDLNLQFFTRSAQELLGIVASDVGKPFARLELPFEDRELRGDIRAVLIRGSAVERDVRDGGGRWYKRSISSYLGDGTAAAGVVISLVDITERKLAALRVAQLTARERDVIEQVVAGHPSKVIGFNLAISRRTVEYHRQRAMAKLKVVTLADLIRLCVLAGLRLFLLAIWH